MSRLGRVARRPDQWSSPHERARTRAAERIDSPLDPAEAAWLDAHLDECAACAGAAAAYDADRLELRSLRDDPIEPPRDLWARTAAGIEREAAHRGRGPRRAAGTATSGRSRFPIGALSGIAVVAIVVGATALSGGWLDQPTVAPTGAPVVAGASQDVAIVTVPPAATPMVVAAGNVGWVHSTDDGAFAYITSPVDNVCPVDDQPGCAALAESAPKRLTLGSTPRSIIGSPSDDQAVVVGSDGSGSDQVFLLSLPANPATTEVIPASAAPTDTAEPTESASASTTPAPSETVTSEPSGPGETPSGSTVPPSDASSSSPETASPDPTPAATPEPTPIPTASPMATATAIAIATGVKVVGQSAAFSADGTWFAFTAEPADGSAGPDVYVWHMGDETAERLTTDGSSVFASWAGDKVVGSRLQATGDGVLMPVSFLADPKTRQEMGDPISLWRPVLDPTGRFAVGWSGAVTTGDDGTRLGSDAGELVLTTWQPDAGTSAARSKVPGVDAEIAEFDVRWDGSGEWLAIWTAQPADPTIGRLSLFRLDRGSGELQRPKGSPTDVPALPGFSIGDGRLAWVTPHGQDAEGSKVQVVAWSGDSVGAVESVPGEDVVVVR
jgi:hypothetical protein